MSEQSEGSRSERIAAQACPFCGDEPSTKPVAGTELTLVKCENFDCALYGGKFTLGRWNRRTADADLRAECDSLRRDKEAAEKDAKRWRVIAPHLFVVLSEETKNGAFYKLRSDESFFARESRPTTEGFVDARVHALRFLPHPHNPAATPSDAGRATLEAENVEP